jgi:hypothetical protein
LIPSVSGGYTANNVATVATDMANDAIDNGDLDTAKAIPAAAAVVASQASGGNGSGDGGGGGSSGDTEVAKEEEKKDSFPWWLLLIAGGVYAYGRKAEKI